MYSFIYRKEEGTGLLVLGIAGTVLVFALGFWLIMQIAEKQSEELKKASTGSSPVEIPAKK